MNKDFIVKGLTDFTIVSNVIFRDKRLSFKTKGLLITMLSLPEEWDFTIKGLVSLGPDGRDSISKSLKELEDCGYIERFQTRYESGIFGKMKYIVYPYPKENNEIYEENPKARLETNKTFMPEESEKYKKIKLESQSKLKNKKTEEIKEEIPSKEMVTCGEFCNVYLTPEEYEEIMKKKDGPQAIDYLSCYMMLHGKNYNNHYLAIRTFGYKAVEERREQEREKRQKQSGSKLKIYSYTNEELTAMFPPLDEVEI